MRCDLFFSPSDGKEFTSRFDVYLVTVEIAFTPVERIIVFFFFLSLFSSFFYSNSLEISAFRSIVRRFEKLMLSIDREHEIRLKAERTVAKHAARFRLYGRTPGSEQQ